ncbi:beta strand repeat-containing protein, partial [Limnohabitans sp.]|uniref:beta strand repeat-containing protein n=1 Tax=Limnohabitans sp. TaxID=1907725 RepID=UPI0038BB65F9
MKHSNTPSSALIRSPRLVGSSRFRLDPLEPRMLLSASTLAVLVDALTGTEVLTGHIQEDATLLAQQSAPADAGMGGSAFAAPVASTGDASVLDVGASVQHVSGATVRVLAGVTVDGSVGVSAATSMATTGVAVAFDEAWAKVRQALKDQPVEGWFEFFPGSDASPNADWLARATTAVSLIESGQLPWTQVAVSGSVLGQAYAAFAVQGQNGAPSILVNLDRIQALTNERDLVTVLVEEIGHGIDYLINAAHDSPGDEGELFAAHVMGVALSTEVRTRILAEDDSTQIQWLGRSVRVEQALSITTDSSATSVSFMADDLVTVTGARTVAASANMQIGIDSFSTLNGGSNGTDSLTLKSNANVVVKSQVGDTDPLNGLTITGLTSSTAPTSVTFNSNVVLAGDLTINCSGTVIFRGDLTLTSGNLSITGATQILFDGAVSLAGGNITLEGNRIEFQGSDFRSDGAVLTLRPASRTVDIRVADPYSQVANALDLNYGNGGILSKVAQHSFSKIVIGYIDSDLHAFSNAGKVYIGANSTATQATFSSPLEVYGYDIQVDDLQGNIGLGGSSFVVYGDLKLEAYRNITLYNAVEAKTVSGFTETLKPVTLFAKTGAIAQLNQADNLGGDGISAEALRGSTLTATSVTGISLIATEFDTVTLLNSGATGGITLQETANGGALTVLKAQISNAANTSNIDISTLGGVLTVASTGSGGSGVTTASTTTGNISLRAKTNLVLNQSVTAPGTIKLVAVDGSVSQAASQSLSATRLLIQAATGAGTTTQALQASVQQLRGLVTTSGGLFVDTQGGVVLDALVTGDAVSESWDLLGGTFALNVTGNLALRVLNGTLDVNSTIQALAVSGVAAQAGNVRLQTSKTVAASSVLTVNAALSAQGHVTLLSDSDVVLTATGDVSLTTAGKNLDIEATLGAVTMQISGTNEAVIQTNAGNVRLSAATAAKNVTLAQVDARSAADRATPALTGQASWGSVSVIAGGSVIDADTTAATDVYAASLRINAGGAVGVLVGTPNVLDVEVQKLSAVALAGVVGVADASALEVGSVAAFSWNRVQADGSVLAGTSDVLQSGVSAADGSVVLTAAGALSVTQAIALTGTPSSTVGNLLLQGADTGVSLSAGVTTAGGAVSVLATAGDVVLGISSDFATSNLKGDITSGAGTVDVQATTGAVTMQVSGANKVKIQTNAANVRLSAATAAKHVTLGLIDTRSTTGRSGTGDADQANWGSVSVVAGGSVLDADTTAVDVYAKNLRLNAGAGIGVLGATPNVLDVEVQTLSAAAAAGGVGLADATALEIGTPASVAWSSVLATGATTSGTADAAQSGITAASGSVVVTAGAVLSVTQAVALTGTPSATVGHVLLQGAGTGVSLSAGLTTAGGSVSVIATAGSVTLGAAGDITVSGSGTVDVQAAQAVTMTNAGGAGTNNEAVITTSGNVSLKATAGDVTLGQISTPTGKVAIQAGGALVDGDTLVDVTALGLYVSTGSAGAVGSGSDALDTAVDTLSLTAGSGGAFVSESAGLDTGNVSVVANRVGAGGVTQAQTAVATSGAGVQSTGAWVVQVLSGDLAVKDGSTAAGITATGHVLLSAAGAVGVQSSLTSAGSVSVVATAGDVTLAAAGDITLSTAAKTVDLEATAGAVVMQVSGSNKAVIQTNAGNVRLSAASAAKNVSLGLVDARSDANRTASSLADQANWGAVSVIAGAAVLDADTSATDVYAASLRLSAGTGVGVLGATPNALDIEVQKLSAVSLAGAVGVADGSGLEVGTTAAVSLSRIKADGTLDTAMTDAAQSGVSTANGAVVLTAAGALSVTQAVALTGTGNLLLQGAGTGVSVTAALGTVTGSVSVVATAGDVVLGSAGDITVATSGTVDVQATAGAVTMQLSGADEAVIQTNAANVRLSAAAATKNVTLGLIDARSNADRTGSALTGQASWGSVSVIAGGSVIDADTTSAATDVYAASLRLNAGGGVGVLGGSVNGLEVEVQKLSAVASAGAVGVADVSALEVGTAAAVSLSRVKTDGTLDTAMTDAAQSGLSAA